MLIFALLSHLGTNWAGRAFASWHLAFVQLEGSLVQNPASNSPTGIRMHKPPHASNFTRSTALCQFWRKMGLKVHILIHFLDCILHAGWWWADFSNLEAFYLEFAILLALSEKMSPSGKECGNGLHIQLQSLFPFVQHFLDRKFPRPGCWSLPVRFPNPLMAVGEPD